MPASSTCASVSLCVWMLWTVKRQGMPMRREAAGMRPVIQSLQWMRSGCTSGMMWLITSRWKASERRGFAPLCE